MYDNAGSAQNAFEGFYNSQLDIVESQDYSGSSKHSYSGNTGYILYNGSQQDQYGKPYAYGGIYLKDNVVVLAETRRDQTLLRNEVDKFLRAIGYPIPSDCL